MSEGSTSNSQAPPAYLSPQQYPLPVYQQGLPLQGMPPHFYSPQQQPQFLNGYPVPPGMIAVLTPGGPMLLPASMVQSGMGPMMPSPHMAHPQLNGNGNGAMSPHFVQQQQLPMPPPPQSAPVQAPTRKKKFNANAASFIPSGFKKNSQSFAPSPTSTTATSTSTSTTPQPSAPVLQNELSSLESKAQEPQTSHVNGHKENGASSRPAVDPKSTTSRSVSTASATSTTETVPSTSSSVSSTSASTPSSASTTVSVSTPSKKKSDKSTASTQVIDAPVNTSESTSNKEKSTKTPEKKQREKKTHEKNTPATAAPSDSFDFCVNGSISLPLLFGSTEQTFVSQRKEYSNLRESKRAALQREAEKKITATATPPQPVAKIIETPKTVPTPSKASTPTTTTTTTQTNGTKEGHELKLASPISSPKPVPAKPVMSGWAAIAQQAAKKHTPKSISASPVTPVSSKREERFVPSVSNVLEPLGVVTLRYMFDKNFLKHANQAKLPKIVPRGLVNTGNICFMSSIVQMLLYCQPFYKALNIISTKTMQSLSREESQTPLFDALVELYSQFNIKLNDKKSDKKSDKKAGFGDSVTPTDFYKAISKNDRFSHLQWGQQEDAEEFFGYLLDGLHEEFTSCVKKLNDHDIKNLMNSTTDDVRNVIKANLRKFHEGEFNSSETSGRSDSMTDDGWQEVGITNKKTAKRTVEVKPSPIRQLFGGQFRSVLTIPKSKDSQSITLDPFQQIQLDISDESTKTLEDAFAKLSEIEEIPYKSTDGSDVLAKKQTFIDKFPEVLVVHLKRFSFASNRRIEKLRKKIAYPHDLKIPSECISPSTKKFMSGDVEYKLTGVVYHHGMGSDGGHYTVDTLRGDEGKWIRIDDVNITNLTLEEVLNGENDEVKTAYILMYQKV